jgi:hypothetical protein
MESNIISYGAWAPAAFLSGHELSLDRCGGARLPWSRRVIGVVGKRLILLIGLLIFLSESVIADESKAFVFHNRTDALIRAFLVQADIERVFCIVEIAPQTSVHVRNVSVGEWYAVAIDIRRKIPVAASPLVLEPDNPDGILTLTGGPDDYRLTPF